jgi:hypothetical protein
MKVLDAIALVAIIAALIAAPFFLFLGIPYLTSRSGNSRSRGLASIIVFAISVLIGLAAAETSTEIGHHEVLRKLDSLKENCRVSINGNPVANSQEIISVLKSLDRLPVHHSSPTKRININITDHAPRLALSLGRDSGDPREHWVFWREYRITAYNEIGRIKTPLFDAY